MRPFPTPSTTTTAAGLLDANMSNPVQQWNMMTKLSTAPDAFVDKDTRVVHAQDKSISDDAGQMQDTVGANMSAEDVNLTNLIAHDSRAFASKIRRLQGRTSVLWYHLLYALKRYRQDTLAIGQYEPRVAKAIANILYTHVKNCDYGLELADETNLLHFTEDQKLKRTGVFRPRLEDTLTDATVPVPADASLNIANFYDNEATKKTFVQNLIKEFAKYTVNDTLQLCFRAMIAAQRRRTLAPAGAAAADPDAPEAPLTLDDPSLNFGRA